MKSKQRTGRPRIIATPKEFDTLAERYFAECEAANEPVLLTGLILALGLGSKQSLYEYRDRPEYSDSVKRALLRVEMTYEKSLRKGGNTAADIFALKNFEWSDRTSFEHSSPDGSMTPKPALDLSHLGADEIIKVAKALPQEPKE